MNRSITKSSTTLLLAALALLLATPAAVAQIEPPEDWLAEVTEGIQAQEYHFSWKADGQLSAPNRAHDLRTSVTGSGFRVVSRTEGESKFDLDLRLERFGRGENGAAVGAGELAGDEGRVDLHRPGLTEWFVNDERGLEHGFDIPEPPAGTRGEVVLVLALEGSLLAYPMGHDSRGVLLRNPKGDDVLKYAGLTVLDAVGNELPARIEIAIGEIRILFDDGDAVYPVTVDPVLSGVVWNVTGLLFWGLGASVSTAGDVNGDGYSDVIVGTPLYDGGQTDEGLASVYHGSPSGLSTTAAWSFVSGRQQARFGAAVSTAGDVDGDGHDDVIIGAPYYFNGHLEEGRAYVFHGSASGISGGPWITESNEVFAHYGAAVDFAGDVNNDGYHDVVVGAPLIDLAAADGGAIYVYFGSSSGLSTTADWVQPSAHAGAHFGTSVAGVGDVNGDGFSDVAGGGPMYDFPIEDQGRVFIYHGSATVPQYNRGIVRDGTANLSENHFGISVAGAGDLNGDGYADIVVGAPGHYQFVPENRAGSFSVFYGSASGVTSPGDLIGPSNDHLGLGQSVSTAGDINGDGFADIIVGAPETEEVLVYCGSRAGIAECANPVSLQNGSEFGATVNTAGDVNGDGYSDVIVGSPSFTINSFVYGRAYVYHGGPEGLVTDPEIDNGTGLGRLGMAVASAGDVNGDGFSDILFGEPEYDGGTLDEGRVFVHYGSRDGLSGTDTLAINLENARFGAALSSAGDVDGDGYDDVVVGAPGYGIGAGLNTGRIWIYPGGPSGLGTASIWTLGGSQADSFFGSALASGDVNGDGYSDVVIGAYGQDGNEGEVWVYQGSASGLSFSSNWPISTDVAGGEFGRSVAMGDINGDGYSETIVGAPEDSTVGGGRIYLFNGSAEGPASTFTFAYGGTPGESLGWSVASGGDVNGDGLEEFVVGGPGFSSPELGEGRILLFGGYPGGGIVVLASRQSDVGGAFLGLSVALVGDVNGDGYSEVVAGAPSHTSAGSADPFVWVWHGSPSGITSSFSWESGPGVLGSRTLYGASVAGAGDINGDGFDELLVGVPDAGSQTIEAFGAVSLYLGGGGHGMDRIPRQQQPFGTSDPPVALRGRSTDDDSVRLRSRARTAAGRDLVQVEYEVKALGDPLDGTGTTLSNSELLTSSPGSDGSRVNYSTRINGLTDGPYYHWRLRFLSPNPKFPRTPWMRCPGIAPTQRGFMTSCNALAWYRDSDGDGYGSPDYRLDRCDPQVGYVLNGTDCNDFDEDVFPGAPEINNGQDDQCSGDPGYGLVDEIEPSTGFDNPSVFCWTAQSGATGYEVARSTDPTFQSGCESFFVEGANCIFDTDVPPGGLAYNYLVRAADPFFGSWGVDSEGNERTNVCP